MWFDVMFRALELRFQVDNFAFFWLGNCFGYFFPQKWAIYSNTLPLSLTGEYNGLGWGLFYDITWELKS
jgi:hypothetical protein